MQTSLKTKSQAGATTTRDVESVASYQALRSNRIADRIDQCASDSAKYARALAVSDKIRECGRCHNHYHATDFHNAAGELHDAAGVLYACNERLCPACLSKRGRVARRRAYKAIEQTVKGKGEHWRLITLTMPTLPSVKLEATLQVIQRAWRLLSKRKWWTRLVRAGVKGVEFTLGDERRIRSEGREWSLESDGYHPHLHLLVLAGWVEWSMMRAEWSECLLTAWREQGIENGINTVDGLAVCDVRLAVDRKPEKKSRVVSMQGAVMECCKYITKSDSWLNVPASELAEIANIERWPRMFELLGLCRKAAQPKNATGAGSSERGARDAYLDTQNLSAVKNQRDGPPKTVMRRKTSLREVGRMMIEQGEREKWREHLAEYVSDVRSYRRSQLAQSFPFATFHTLDGHRWYGMKASLANLFFDSVRLEIEESAELERAEWPTVIGRADREAYREHLRKQEEERWHSYVSHGREVLTGAETVNARKKAISDAIEKDIKKPVEERADERSQMAARAFAWELYESSDEKVGTSGIRALVP